MRRVGGEGEVNGHRWRSFAKRIILQSELLRQDSNLGGISWHRLQVQVAVNSIKAMILNE
jgi:hypothetical protein